VDYGGNANYPNNRTAYGNPNDRHGRWLGPKANTKALVVPLRALSKLAERTFTARLSRDPDSGNYAVRCVELPEAISQGRTEEEALRNIKEAVELVLEEYEAEAKREGGKLIQIVV